MPGATPNLGHTWYISTMLLTSLGFYMWPHAFAAAFTARSGETLRRNAVVMPLYIITLPYAAVRDELKRIGRPIPANDLWIAALVRKYALTLLSRDRHFDFVPRLKRVTW